MIGLAVLGLFLLACFSAISFNRVAATKAKEEAIVMDFLVHYTETVKGLPYNQVTNSMAINPMFDGSLGPPVIRIPADSSWVALNTTNFEMFHADLLWIHNRNPQMQVTVDSEIVKGAVHSRHLNVKVAWDAPLRRGGRLQEQLDLVRVKDL